SRPTQKMNESMRRIALPPRKDTVGAGRTDAEEGELPERLHGYLTKRKAGTRPARVAGERYERRKPRTTRAPLMPAYTAASRAATARTPVAMVEKSTPSVRVL